MTYLSEVETKLLPLLPSATLLRKDYVFTGVCLSVHRGGCVSQHALEQIPPGPTYPSMHWGRHPPGQTYPSMHWGRYLPWVDISQHALGQTLPDGYCSGRYASYWNAFLFTGVFH